MSNPSWLAQMKASLTRLQQADANTAHPRVALLGVGHPLNGDDAAGIAVAGALRDAFAGSARVLVLEAGPAPENFTGVLRDFRPALVIFIDAAHMHAEPGAIRWLDWRDTTGLSASTHTLPPSMLAKFLVAELGCEVALLGLQPACNAVAAPLSPAMRQAVDAATAGLLEALSPPA